jgi:transposase
MARRWIGSDQGAQPALLPVDARDLLPAGHVAFDVIDLVAGFDLSAFAGRYRADGVGRPPFAPRLLLTLIVYCNAKGIRSARQIAAACYDDLGARVITGNRYPDRATIDRFVTTHGAAIQALLPQTLRMGYAEGLVDVSVVAGDGTKVLANAAMHATTDEAGLTTQITDLHQQITATEALWLQQLAAETGAPTHHTSTLFDTPDTPDTPDALPDQPVAGPAAGTWRRLSTLRVLLRARQAALAHLHANPNTDVTEWADRLERDQTRVQTRTEALTRTRGKIQAAHDRRAAAEAAGHRIPGTRPVPVEDHAHVRAARKALAVAVARAETTAAERPTTTKVNTTDPGSRIMPGKHDGYGQRHNIQAMVCTNQFILAVTDHPNSNDKQALTTLITTTRTNLDHAGITDPIGTALHDSGYASEANFTADLPVTNLLIAVEREARQTGRLRDCTSTAATAWQSMTDRLDQPDNRTLYKQRSAMIEPLFAQLFNRFGRHLNYHGDAVTTELHLWAVTHNILKIRRHHHKPRPPT